MYKILEFEFKLESKKKGKLAAIFNPSYNYSNKKTYDNNRKNRTSNNKFCKRW